MLSAGSGEARGDAGHASSQAELLRTQVRTPPPLTSQDAIQLRSDRLAVTSALSSESCANSATPIAFSVTGVDDVSAGQDSILLYAGITTNEGSGWVNPSTFIAPCGGLYHFSITFLKDSAYFNGTQDDVWIYFTKTDLQNRRLAIPGRAWSGEGDGMRGTGAFNVAIRLAQGESVQSLVSSDSGLLRHVWEFNLTGFRIAP
jgi:hypothetical protein